VYRCCDASCTLHFAHPQPTDSFLDAAYASDHRKGFDGSTPRTYAHALVRALAIRTGGLTDRRVLDFGAGTGIVAEALFAAGAKVSAIEPSPDGRSAIRRTVGLDAATTLDELGAGPESFDAVVMIEVIEHLRDPRATIASLAPLLRRDGYLFVTTPNLGSLRARIQGARWPNVRSHTHVMYFTARSLERTLTLGGFGDIQALDEVSAHPEHPRLRRLAQRALRPWGLAGGLQFVARPRGADEELPERRSVPT
jgi:SAM-dependent methyltransferase